MDPALYGLNISGPTASSVLIAVFFAVLWRTNRRAELRWWTYGWMANVVALAITSAFWYFEPRTSLFGPVLACYLGAKSFYVWMHVRGVFQFIGRWPKLLEPRQVLPAIAGISVVAVLVITTRDRVGIVSQVLI